MSVTRAMPMKLGNIACKELKSRFRMSQYALCLGVSEPGQKPRASVDEMATHGSLTRPPLSLVPVAFAFLVEDLGISIEVHLVTHRCRTSPTVIVEELCGDSVHGVPIVEELQI